MYYWCLQQARFDYRHDLVTFALAEEECQRYAEHVMETQQLHQAVHPGGTLYFADCLDILQTLPDDSIDCLLTDPPYGIGYRSLSHSLPITTVSNDGPEAYDLLDKALALAASKLKPDSHVYIFSNWQAFAAMELIVRKHFTVKNMLVWDKGVWTRGDYRYNYGYQQELIIYAMKGKRRLNDRRAGNILRLKRVNPVHMQHPTEKPLKLLEYLITKSTNEGETVLDPFMGSGTTCLAAKRLGRGYIGIELERVWYELARSRLDY